MSDCEHYFVSRTDTIQRFCTYCNMLESDELTKLQEKVRELESKKTKLTEVIAKDYEEITGLREKVRELEEELAFIKSEVKFSMDIRGSINDFEWEEILEEWKKEKGE